MTIIEDISSCALAQSIRNGVKFIIIFTSELRSVIETATRTDMHYAYPPGDENSNVRRFRCGV